MTRNEMIRELVTYGHSAFKATEIAINVERGDTYAIMWFSIVHTSVTMQLLPAPNHRL